MSWKISEKNKFVFSEFLLGRLFIGWPITTDEFRAFSGLSGEETQIIINDCIREFGLVELAPTTPPEWNSKPQYGLRDLSQLDTSRLGEFLGLTSEEKTACVVKVQNHIEGFLGSWKERNQ